jgi:hypothetical protein
VTLVVALFPSTAAVIVADPGATPETMPEDETVAFAASEVLNAKVHDKTFPEMSLAVAESWSVCDGTSVLVVADRTTTAVVGGGGGGGGPVGLSPQDPISQQRVINPSEPIILFIAKAIFTWETLAVTQVVAHNQPLGI